MSKFEAYEPKGVNGQVEGAEVRLVGKRDAIACFVAGTRLLTVGGQRPLEPLVPRYPIMTRDHRPLPFPPLPVPSNRAARCLVDFDCRVLCHRLSYPPTPN